MMMKYLKNASMILGLLLFCSTAMAIEKGTVKFFNSTKGFGIIADDNTGNLYFVHLSGLIDEISEGDKVTFDISTSDRDTKSTLDPTRTETKNPGKANGRNLKNGPEESPKGLNAVNVKVV